jgi:hypothetical protein
MSVRSTEQTQATQAYLVLLYGATEGVQRQFPLDRDALIIGKSPGCDLVLQAPDVSHLHCVITRHAGCWTVRDCHSRSGVRVNGDKICEASLHDEDILHIGPFSFRAVLPPQRTRDKGRTAEARLLRLDQKRRNLTRLALAQRRRLHQVEARLRHILPAASVEDMHLERTHPTAGPEEQLGEVQERQVELNQAELDLDDRRAALERDIEEFRERMLRKELELRDRRTILEREWQQRRAELNQEAVRRRKEGGAGPNEQAEKARELAAHVESLERKLAQQRQEFEQELARRRAEWYEEHRQRPTAVLPLSAGAAAPPTAAEAADAKLLEKTRLFTAEELEKTRLFPDPDKAGQPPESELGKTQFVPGLSH